MSVKIYISFFLAGLMLSVSSKAQSAEEVIQKVRAKLDKVT